MNTICKFGDIDTYLLYYVDIKKILELTTISKDQNTFMFNLDFIKQLRILVQKYRYKNIIDNAAKHNYISLINWIANSINKFKYTAPKKYMKMHAFSYIFYGAFYTSYRNFCFAKTPRKYRKCMHFHIFSRAEEAIENAAEYGHIDIIIWFAKSGYEFQYTQNAIFYASTYGHIDVLEWFANSKVYEFKYSRHAIDYAAENGQIEILSWFANSKYEFKYSDDAIDYAAENGYIDILNWFSNSKYEFKYTGDAIYCALKEKRMEILKWFDESKYEIKYDDTVHDLLDNDYVEILRNYLGPNSRILKIIDK